MSSENFALGRVTIQLHGPTSLSNALIALSMGYMSLGGMGGYTRLAKSDYD